MTVEMSPELRAREAVEVEVAAGRQPTQRGIRSAARVSQTVAAEALQAWRVEQQEAAAVPEMPQVVLQRLGGVWVEAYRRARVEFETEVAGWSARVRSAQEDRVDAADAAREAEARVDVLTQDLARVTEQLNDAAREMRAVGEQFAETRGRLSATQARVEAAEERTVELQGQLRRETEARIRAGGEVVDLQRKLDAQRPTD